MTRRVWWPFGPASVLVPAVAIVAVVVGMTWSMLWWPYPEWRQTSEQFHQQFAFAGMIAGCAACWYATVLHSRGRIWLQPGAPRAGAPAVTRHIFALSCWFLVAYVVGLLPLVVSTVVAGGVGPSEPLAILSGLLAMVAAVALGYAVGVLLPHLAVVPVLAVGFYALLAAGNAGGERFASISPVLYFEAQLGGRESLPLQVFRISVFVLVAVAAVGLAGKAGHRVATGTRLIGGAALYLALPAVLIAVSLVRQPAVFVADGRPAATCTERRDIRYCVHVENQPRLAELVSVVDPVIMRFGTKPTNLDLVWDKALTYHEPFGGELVDGREIADLLPDGSIQVSAAAVIAGLYACPFDEPNEERSEKELQKLTSFAWNVTDYLEQGIMEESLAGMSVADVQDWLARHQEQLQNCTLTPDQLPDARAR